ncbi:1-phosphofructokinase family hexose kinase [Candidatus Bipolaricaulota bacterium]
MIVTVTLNPAVDKMYWVDSLRMHDVTQEEFLTRATRSTTSAGGKGVNISVFLSRLGLDNVAMGFVGGYTGHVVVRDLRDEGVTTNFVWTHGETRVNVTLLQAGREHSPNLINESGPTILPEEVNRLMRRYRIMLGRASWVVLAGSLPPGVDPGIYREMAQMAKDAGAKVILSTGGEALTRSLEACPYIVKPDTREHLTLEGQGLTSVDAIVEAGKHVIACGAEIVIISHDVTGDIAITRDDVWEINASTPTSKFKNLVGADDVLLGGILYKLAHEAPVDEALKFGLAAGIASAECEEKICRDMAAIEQELPDVTLSRL